ncbi:hypothetical protein CDG81_04815 [Actinopolyspora erythraea]|uniref:Uncharacterized protein n=1 Tax=Actinopolyspora erythraea TaxID=414996 RepID=A0A099D207_9ACTN|nr:hypothetical protein [Actinopolyspora erythraea]ASU77749.1 hypothetical protein CDG81_04815 [Actinopolyspora erythraea]KGI79956.1 hypothetical protein IL38_19795 [Actinopolyspora erythraea]
MSLDKDSQKEIDDMVRRYESLAASWLTPGEELIWQKPAPEAHAASFVGDLLRAPHTPLGVTDTVKGDSSEWRLPSSVVTERRFLTDEWADDPAIHCWATAKHPDNESIRFADHLAASHGHPEMLATNERLALVLDASLIATAEQSAESGSSGLLDKARRMARHAQETASELSHRHGKGKMISFYEITLNEIRNFGSSYLGRSVPRREFLRFDFFDGSNVIIETGHADKHARRLNELIR